MMTVKEVCPLLTDAQCAQCERYLDLIEEVNAHTNLTAIRDRNEMVTRHIADSLAVLPVLGSGARVLDIGCGAGLPSLPVKIARPDLDFLLVDSVRKKIDFVNTVIADLRLDRISAVHSRIEDLTDKTFDFVLARAVAALNVLVEYSLPFLKVGGRLIAYKGESAAEEIAAAQNALRLVGGEVEEVKNVFADGMRHTLVIVQKTAPTPAKYPRPRNLPRTQPL